MGRFVDKIKRGVLVLQAMALVIGTSLFSLAIPQAAHAADDGYPDANMPCAHSPYATSGTGFWCENYDWGPVHATEPGWAAATFSSRGYGYRNCTDYVAWKVKQVFNVTLPTNWGNAKSWADAAVAAGYSLDAAPRVGDLAVWTGGTYGHVAYVYGLDGSGTPKLAEFNKLQDGTFHDDRVATADKYIHIGDLADTAMAGNPTAVSRGSGAMNVFYRTADSKLVARGWDVNSGWNFSILATDVAGDPVAVMRGDNMEVFYRNSNQGVSNVGWNPTTGWHAPVQVGVLSSGVLGNPAVVARDVNHMDVFYRTINNELKTYTWNSTSGWGGLLQLSGAGELQGNPSVVARDANHMDVYYRRPDGRLGDYWWQSTGWWNWQDWPADVASGATPQPVARTDGSMNVFFRKNNGWIINKYWDWINGWNFQEWSASLVSDPAVAVRNSGTLDAVYRETGNNIKGIQWDWQVGWSSTSNLASDATGDPVMVARDTNNLDVFYRSVNDNKLRCIHWSPSGWQSPTTVN